jgi:DNA-binding NtrC family response regulator
MANPVHWQPGVTLEEVKKQTVEAALRYTNGNKTEAARILGVSVRKIFNDTKEDKNPKANP